MDFNPIPATYPFSRRDTSVRDTYFGQLVSDPYRWLEDDQSPETMDWVRRQNLVAYGYLSQIPFRDKIKQRLQSLWNYERYAPPTKAGGRYFFFKNDGLQNQSVLYAQDSPLSDPQPLLDPNRFSADGTASIGEISFSKNGRYLAYSVSESGSDWRTIRVMDLKGQRSLSDEIRWAKFTEIAWAGDGFYYSRYPEPQAGDKLKGINERCAIYYHALGQPQSADRLVHQDEDNPRHYHTARTTRDERFLVLSTGKSTSGNQVAFKSLAKGEKSFTQVVVGFEHDFDLVGNLADELLFLTNASAPRGRIVRVSAERPDSAHWATLIPEHPSEVLESAALCGDKIVCSYLRDASSALRAFDLDGNLIQEIQLPEMGTLSGLSGRPGDPEAFFSFQSFLRPAAVYRLDIPTLSLSVFKAPRLDFNPEAYVTEQVRYKSKDGTEIPMFITRKKHIRLDGSNPVLLYGYGGFNVSITPAFSPSRAAFLENNGIYAVANLRGGGEYGEPWHKAGVKCRKQNVFDDFIAAAEYLIGQKYTSPERLAIQGGSNGGLLVGACMTQRPDLFGVCLPAVGVLDMLRYHLFTIGYAWADDYGRSDQPDEFPCLFAYSPLHRLRPAAYPATLITTADHDDRVAPAHSFKFAATLQANQQGPKPTLIRIETNAGHGAGKPTDKAIEEAADILAFVFYNMKFMPIY
ncbi:MAG: prolyl oligopeptidase family serine peptidase [Saprospiraceae bacterium]